MIVKKRKNKPGAGRRPMNVNDRKAHDGLPKELHDWVVGIAVERGVSQNAVIRQAVEWYRNAIDLQKPIGEVAVLNNE